MGIDRPGNPGPLPHTMQANRMEGTPTLLVFDRQEKLRLLRLGQVEGLAMGELIGQLPAQAACRPPTRVSASVRQVDAPPT